MKEPPVHKKYTGKAPALKWRTNINEIKNRRKQMA